MLSSEVKSTFYKINVHAALTPDQIWNYLQPAIEQANSLREDYEQGENKAASLRLPFVTVCTLLSFALSRECLHEVGKHELTGWFLLES